MTFKATKVAAAAAQAPASNRPVAIDRYALEPYRLRSSSAPLFLLDDGREVIGYVVLTRNATKQSFSLTFEVKGPDGFTEVSSDELVKYIEMPHPRDQGTSRDKQLHWELEFDMFLVHGVLSDELLAPMKTALEQHLSSAHYVLSPFPTSAAGRSRAKKGGAA